MHYRAGRQRDRAEFEAAAGRPLVKALARAWRWQRLLDEGVYANVSEIGDVENMSKSYVSRILQLALLAPDIVEEILEGRQRDALLLERLRRGWPVDWAAQRSHLHSLDVGD